MIQDPAGRYHLIFPHAERCKSTLFWDLLTRAVWCGGSALARPVTWAGVITSYGHRLAKTPAKVNVSRSIPIPNSDQPQSFARG